MQLTFWTYEGPPHVGAIRIAASMRDVHLLLHSPQGDTYADLLFTMIERLDHRPPVTYTTFQDRDLGGSTAELVLGRLRDAYDVHRPQLMLVADSCTAELLQDQTGALAGSADLPCPVIPLEMQAYSRKENWGAAETFYALVRGLLGRCVPAPGWQRPAREPERRPTVNLLGPTALGFRCRDDVKEVCSLLDAVGIGVNVVAPAGASPHDLLRLPEADANVCLYPEVAGTACQWLQRNFQQPTVKTVPIGRGATQEFLSELGEVLGIEIDAGRAGDSNLPWYSRSVDSTYLTGKRVFIFGDATHASAAARIASDELGFKVVGLGTYSREQARALRETASRYELEALITDDYLEVEQKVAELQPELVLGTQMERHIAKRLGVPCAVISTPAHVQDYPARYSPQMGFEGANVIFDSWVHPLMMGLEEHLLAMFRDDFEFSDSAVPSHLACESDTAQVLADVAQPELTAASGMSVAAAPGSNKESAPGCNKESAPGSNTESAPGLNEAVAWELAAEQELRKIPFFVRGKARRNTETFAVEQGINVINVETLYEAKAHYSR
ncbi:MAG: ferredoxin:protochlorophyllide reductase (ATP-dependent) subunit B [Pseudomonadota bacterium]